MQSDKLIKFGLEIAGSDGDNGKYWPIDLGLFYMNNDGDWYLNDEKVSLDDMKEKFSEALRKIMYTVMINTLKEKK